MVEQDLKIFYESINKEFDLLKDRIRNIIGDSHWGEEGRYKEAILKNIIRKFIPKTFSIGTGFIINSKKEVSTQLDIIIYENNSPLLFQEGDFIIVPASGVMGVIEVKTKINSLNGNNINSLNDILTTFKNIKEILKKDKGIDLENVFMGIFSYNSGINNIKNIDENTESNLKNISHIALGSEYFIRKTKNRDNFEVSFYELTNLSFVYFIGNLISHLGNWKTVFNDKIFYPLPSKEPSKIHSITL